MALPLLSVREDGREALSAERESTVSLNRAMEYLLMNDSDKRGLLMVVSLRPSLPSTPPSSAREEFKKLLDVNLLLLFDLTESGMPRGLA